MKFESNLEEGMSYIGTVDAVRQTYYIFEATDVFIVFSLSATRLNSGNFSLVPKKSVDYVYKCFSDYEEVSSNDVLVRAKRTKHVASTLVALNILYVLTAQARARIQSIGSHSKLLFEIGPELKRRRLKKKKVTKTAKKKAKRKVKKRAKKAKRKIRKIVRTVVGTDDDYREYFVETYDAIGEPSSSDIRVRPLVGQGLDTDLKVRCSKALRSNHKVGTIFKLLAKVTDREGGTPFLHSPYTWGYEVLTKRQAKAFVSRNF